ncbi:hypothetical protein GN956_G23463 [Arapaima gigas]
MSCGMEGPQWLRTSKSDTPTAAYPEECEGLQETPCGLTEAATQHHHLQEPVVSSAETTPFQGPPSSWSCRSPPAGHAVPCTPRLIICTGLTKLPPEITVTPPTPTLTCPRGSVAKDTRLKLKGTALPSRLTDGEKLEGRGQPSQDPPQHGHSAALGCEEEVEAFVDI